MVTGRPWVADGALAVVLAVLLLPATTSTVWETSWPPAVRVAIIGAMMVGHGCVAVRRVAPRPAFIAACGVMLGLVGMAGTSAGIAGLGFHPILLPSTMVFPVLLYTVAAWCRPAESLLALAAACVGAGAVFVQLWGADYLTVAHPGLADRDDPVRSWQLFLVIGLSAAIAAPWGLGRYRRLRTEYVRMLEERARREAQDRAESARRAAARERVRIARELHDVVAHSLSVMVSQAEGGRMMAASDPSVSAPVLETVARTGQEAMRDMRSLLDALHDGGSPEVESPQPSLRALPELVERVRRSGLAVAYDEIGEPIALGAAGELAAYRVVQEALTNVLKHAGTEAGARVALRWLPDRLAITVGNRGAGPPGGSEGTGRGSAGTGRGLAGMAERLTLLGGTLRAEPGDDGFQVAAVIPTPASAARKEPQ